MKMTDGEKKLLGLFREMESQRIRDDLLSQAGAMVRAQRAFKEDYGIPDREPETQQFPQDAAV
jgi:hypothetical protein